MLVKIRDDTWNVLNMQHIIPNSKRWDYSDIPGCGQKYIKDPPTWLKVVASDNKAGIVTTLSLAVMKALHGSAFSFNDP